MTDLHHLSRTRSQRGQLLCPALLENYDLFQCPGRMRAQGSDFPSAPGTGVPKLNCSGAQTALGFPWRTWKLSIAAADVYTQHGSGQTTQMP